MLAEEHGALPLQVLTRLLIAAVVVMVISWVVLGYGIIGACAAGFQGQPAPKSLPFLLLVSAAFTVVALSLWSVTATVRLGRSPDVWDVLGFLLFIALLWIASYSGSGALFGVLALVGGGGALRTSQSLLILGASTLTFGASVFGAVLLNRWWKRRGKKLPDQGLSNA